MISVGTSLRLLLVPLLAATAAAQNGDAPGWRADLAYASRHVFRGVARADSSVQPALEASRGGLKLGLWANLPFERAETAEADLSARYAWPVTAKATLELSLTQSWFSGDAAEGTDRSFEAGLAATLPPVVGFIPGMAYYHDLRLQSDTMEASLARSIPLTRLGTFLDLNFFAGWADGDDWRPDAPGPPRQDGYGYWGAEMHLPYRLGAHLTAVAGVHYSDSSGRSDTQGPFGQSTRQIFWLTLGASVEF